MRTTGQRRKEVEERIRAMMDRLLSGDIPPGGRCDLKTLAAQSGVSRTSFYSKKGKPGPYQHLAEEFDYRRRLCQKAGNIPDPREERIARLKGENGRLKDRIFQQEITIKALSGFKAMAVSRLAAQHDELRQFRPMSGDAHAAGETFVHRAEGTETRI